MLVFDRGGSAAGPKAAACQLQWLVRRPMRCLVFCFWPRHGIYAAKRDGAEEYRVNRRSSGAQDMADAKRAAAPSTEIDVPVESLGNHYVALHGQITAPTAAPSRLRKSEPPATS
jgi:hypothetical protein